MPVVFPRLRLTLVSARANQIALNSIHYAPSADVFRDVNTTTLTDIATALSALLAPDYADLLSPAASFLGVRLRYEAPFSISDQEVVFAGDAQAGTWPDLGDAPGQLCGLVRKRAVEGGRHARGRLYIPFVGETAVNADGSCSAAYLAELSGLATQLRSSITYSWAGVDTILRPCIFAASRISTPFFITSTTFATAFATQRRRGYFGRSNPAVL